MEEGKRIGIGVRVRVVNSESPDYGRFAKVIGEAESPGGKGWLIAFEYPLGGIVGRTAVAEADLEAAARL
ncbi:MAG: hypothetical protein HY532_03950 [Chloroflexi bacterium]|nr:hypothetical protein [Chloroflexota bacterium]